MPVVRLPDGSSREFPQAVTAKEVAQSIGAGLARAAIAAQINGKLVDLSTLITEDVDLSLITEKDPAALEVIRHSMAHLLAQAVKQCFPEAQVTIGPVIENGFYYDFAYTRAFTPEDLKLLEKTMQELAKKDFTVTRTVKERAEAIAYFEGMGEKYKAELIRDIPGDEPISLYTQGDFTDLCRGPHVPSTGKLKVFKLMKVAGAYWRGNSKNEMLQRIYGTAWLTKADQETYLTQLEEAEKRDHRKLGKALDLFHFQEEGPGMVFWHPKGWTLYQLVENYMRETIRQNGYQEIRTPQVLDRTLWEKSGHWEKFAYGIFTTHLDERDYAIKPMNCPGHIQVFNQGLKSYRDLPIRLAEFGTVHRNEHSGSLQGLMRLRAFTQDDAHVFCTEDQLEEEVITLIDLLYRIYADFGFTEIGVKLSTRPEQRIGADEVWDKAETALAKALDNKGLKWELQPGEGAFYGPKIEFQLKDSIGRVWQCGTVQVDFSMPGRLGASYVAEDNSRQTPVMIHRAIFGSLERFIGILIEHHAGLFPLWLAPVQATVLNISEHQADYATQVQNAFQKAGFRVELDLRNEKISYKIREHTLGKMPFLIIVGEKEKAEGKVTVRTRQGKDLGQFELDQLIDLFNQTVRDKK